MAAAAGLVRLADLVAIPYPIVLVLGGLAMGLIPGRPELALEPEVIFLVFLPPLLHSAGWYTSVLQLRADARPIALMSIGLVVVTIATVAVAAHALVDGMSWAAAFTLGAILAPTDPIAAIATFGRIGVPDRVRAVVEGDALLNDAVPLVAFRIAVGAATTGAFSIVDAGVEFLVSAAGGIAVGLAVGWVARELLRRQRDQALAILMSLLVAYASYVIAEELHVSGVLGAVVSGLFLGWHAPRLFDADTRLSAVAFWEVLVFALNVLLFVLLGVQFPSIVEQLEARVELADVLWSGALLALVVVVVRMLWMLLPEPGFGETVQERLLVGWSGMRGAVSLAAALSVPEAVAERDAIVVMTVVVIALTLVGQGLTLPAVIRALGLGKARAWSFDEALARLDTAQAALERIDELVDEDRIGEDQAHRMRALYRARVQRCQLVLGGGDGGRDGGDGRDGGSTRLRDSELRRELIAVERDVLVGLRDSGGLRIPDVRAIERDLDLEDARLSAR